MAGSKSNAFETSVLQWALAGSGTTPTRPTSWTIGLFTDASGTVTDQPSTEAVDTGGGCPGYSRKTVSSWSISGTNPTQATNTNAITFTATGTWLPVNYFGVFDQTGAMIYWGSIPTKTLANTDQLQFAIGAITIQED